MIRTQKGRGKKIGDERRNPSGACGGKGEECELERVKKIQASWRG